eukprot:TRINITY_DN29139_c0_g1_i1.p1 TRINITY_DN29139_c0_g1~~TRINITY_DN29139_c0_g1_i1.p1  ORF type:complete len:371 (+),score=42.73 TRINITY_DN29139_c0_g1_i1:123-1235(+)
MPPRPVAWGSSARPVPSYGYACKGIVCILLVGYFIACLVMSGDQQKELDRIPQSSEAGRWVYISRDAEASFLCEKPVQSCEDLGVAKWKGRKGSKDLSKEKDSPGFLQYYIYEGYCYGTHTTEKTFLNARKDCESDNATLAIISSAQENVEAAKACSSDYGMLCLIGLECLRSNQCEWVDGSIMSLKYQNWARLDKYSPLGEYLGEENDVVAILTDHFDFEARLRRGFEKFFIVSAVALAVFSTAVVGFFFFATIFGIRFDSSCLVITGITGDCVCGCWLCIIALILLGVKGFGFAWPSFILVIALCGASVVGCQVSKQIGVRTTGQVTGQVVYSGTYDASAGGGSVAIGRPVTTQDASSSVASNSVETQ